MEFPEFPVPMGVFRSIERPTYENLMIDQIDRAVANKGSGSLEKLLHSGETWVIGPDGNDAGEQAVNGSKQ
jgi:2-oxoglutarate/2-oxoacid ferredoxin oxidoreductase subunit beta